MESCDVGLFPWKIVRFWTCARAFQFIKKHHSRDASLGIQRGDGAVGSTRGHQLFFLSFFNFLFAGFVGKRGLRTKQQIREGVFVYIPRWCTEKLLVVERSTYLYICDKEVHFTRGITYLYTKRQKEASQMKQVFFWVVYIKWINEISLRFWFDVWERHVHSTCYQQKEKKMLLERKFVVFWGKGF